MEYKKLLIVGEESSGKSCFVERLRTGEYETRYISTMGVEVHPIRYNDNVTFKVWDVAGNELFGGLRSGYYIGGECCLVFVDLSIGRSVVELREIINGFVLEVRGVCEDIPVILVGSKMDLVDEVDSLRLYNASSGLGIQRYYNISNLSMVNINQPLEALTQIMGYHEDN